MEFGEIFNNALKYPISDYQKLLTVGAIYVLTVLSSIFVQLGVRISGLNLIFSLISLVATILLLGYGLSVVKSSIELDDVIPDFDWAKNLKDGVKYVIVAFVYLIIPTIITFVVGIALGAGPLAAIFTENTLNGLQSANTSSQVTQVLNSVPQEAWSGLFTAIAITAVVAIILFVIFTLFLEIAICRLAKYDTIGEAFSFGQIWDDLKEIGILKVLGFIIVLSVIASIIGIIIGFISAIPIIGVIIGALVGSSFSLLFSNRAVGLLYSEI